MLKLHLDVIEALKAALSEVDAAVGNTLAPVLEAVDLLKTIPGVSDVVANVIVAEIGVDMSRFPTAGHLLSWAGNDGPRVFERAAPG